MKIQVNYFKKWYDKQAVQLFYAIPILSYWLIPMSLKNTDESKIAYGISMFFLIPVFFFFTRYFRYFTNVQLILTNKELKIKKWFCPVECYKWNEIKKVRFHYPYKGEKAIGMVIEFKKYGMEGITLDIDNLKFTSGYKRYELIKLFLKELDLKSKEDIEVNFL